MVRPIALLAVLFSACGPVLPDGAEVYLRLREGGDQCISDVGSLVTETPWLADFETRYASDFAAYVEKIAVPVTEPTDFEILVEFSPAPGVRLRYSEVPFVGCGTGSEFSLKITNMGHTFALSRFINCSDPHNVKSGEWLYVDDQWFVGVSDEVECKSPNATYAWKTETAESLESYAERPYSMSAFLASNGEFWGAFAHKVHEGGYDDRPTQFSGEVCHDSVCAGLADMNIDSPRATEQISVLFPAFVRTAIEANRDALESRIQ